MTVFMEETSGLIDATNWYGNNGGIGAPPSTPVEYFMDAYGTGNTDIQGREVRGSRKYHERSGCLGRVRDVDVRIITVDFSVLGVTAGRTL